MDTEELNEQATDRPSPEELELRYKKVLQRNAAKMMSHRTDFEAAYDTAAAMAALLIHHYWIEVDPQRFKLMPVDKLTKTLSDILRRMSSHYVYEADEYSWMTPEKWLTRIRNWLLVAPHCLTNEQSVDGFFVMLFDMIYTPDVLVSPVHTCKRQVDIFNITAADFAELMDHEQSLRVLDILSLKYDDYREITNLICDITYVDLSLNRTAFLREFIVPHLFRYFGDQQRLSRVIENLIYWFDNMCADKDGERTFFRTETYRHLDGQVIDNIAFFLQDPTVMVPRSTSP